MNMRSILLHDSPESDQALLRRIPCVGPAMMSVRAVALGVLMALLAFLLQGCSEDSTDTAEVTTTMADNMTTVTTTTTTMDDNVTTTTMDANTTTTTVDDNTTNTSRLLL